MKTIACLSLIACLTLFVGCSASPDARTASAEDAQPLQPFPDMNNMTDGYYNRIQDLP
jgi:hypothetical protein